MASATPAETCWLYTQVLSVISYQVCISFTCVLVVLNKATLCVCQDGSNLCGLAELMFDGRADGSLEYQHLFVWQG